MWELKTQFSTPWVGGTNLEWNAIRVATQEEAELWWQTRTRGRPAARRVHTMTDPDGRIVRVQFD